MAVALVALGLAGCVSPDAAGATDADPAGVDGTDAAVSPKDLKFDGRTMFQTCAGTVIGGQCVVAGGENAWQELTGRTVRVSGEVTWDATTPATGELWAGLLVKEGGEWVSKDLYVRGTSPLAFDWDVSRFKDAQAFGFYVSAWQGAGAAVVWGGVALEQAFTVDGTYEVVEAS